MKIRDIGEQRSNITNLFCEKKNNITDFLLWDWYKSTKVDFNDDDRMYRTIISCVIFFRVQ